MPTIVDQDALDTFDRKLPPLAQSGGILTGEDIESWWAAVEGRVAAVREQVLELGVDAVVAALTDLGVLHETRAWEDPLEW